MAPICHVMCPIGEEEGQEGKKKNDPPPPLPPRQKKMLSSHSPFGRCCFGWCFCPILLWCAAAFSSWMERGYHNNFSFSWLRNKKIRRHRLWAVSESTPWKNLQRRVPRIIQEDPENLLRIFWESSEKNPRLRRGGAEETLPRRGGCGEGSS